MGHGSARRGVARYRCAASPVSTIGFITTFTVVSSSTTVGEAMIAPAVVIAPVGPRAHAKEDAVIEIARPVKANRSAGVGGIVVVAIGTDGLSPYADGNLPG